MRPRAEEDGRDESDSALPIARLAYCESADTAGYLSSTRIKETTQISAQISNLAEPEALGTSASFVKEVQASAMFASTSILRIDWNGRTFNGQMERAMRVTRQVCA